MLILFVEASVECADIKVKPSVSVPESYCVDVIALYLATSSETKPILILPPVELFPAILDKILPEKVVFSLLSIVIAVEVALSSIPVDVNPVRVPTLVILG